MFVGTMIHFLCSDVVAVVINLSEALWLCDTDTDDLETLTFDL